MKLLLRKERSFRTEETVVRSSRTVTRPPGRCVKKLKSLRKSKEKLQEMRRSKEKRIKQR